MMIAVQEMAMRMYWLVIEYDDDSACQRKVYSDAMSRKGIRFCKG